MSNVEAKRLAFALKLGVGGMVFFLVSLIALFLVGEFASTWHGQAVVATSLIAVAGLLLSVFAGGLLWGQVLLKLWRG